MAILIRRHNPMLYTLITNITTELTKGHEKSITHFRNAQVELLKGVRTFIDEEIHCLDQWLENRSQRDEGEQEEKQ
jgi:hypothetical protein